MKILKSPHRVYVSKIEPAIEFYEALQSQKMQLRFRYEKAGLELAQVGDFLLLAGSEEDLAPFKDTDVTVLVDHLEEFYAFLLNQNCLILRGPQQVPTGQNMTVQHPDGLIVEYVEHQV
jgi:hypothetical protein